MALQRSIRSMKICLHLAEQKNNNKNGITVKLVHIRVCIVTFF